ncbi:MAG: TetR/AcrR family transcriptional regulator [Bacteroidota bacterium]
MNIVQYVMGVHERKLREKEALRDHIISVSMDLFAKGGYEAVKMRDVADAAEYSVGTIYNQFKDKNELFLAVQQMAFERKMIYMQDAVKPTMSGREMLLAIGKAYVRFGLENPELYRVMFILDSPMQAVQDHECWHTGLKLHNVLSQVVNYCMEAGALPTVDKLQMSFGLWAMVHGMVSLRVTDRLTIYEGDHIHEFTKVDDPDELIMQTLNMMCDLIFDHSEIVEN